jgi:hypothetical protein
MYVAPRPFLTPLISYDQSLPLIYTIMQLQ